MPESFHTTHVLEEDGKVQLEHLPFARGETVEIHISSRSAKTRHGFPLLGTVSKFEKPTEPVCLEQQRIDADLALLRNASATASAEDEPVDEILATSRRVRERMRRENWVPGE